MRAIQIVNSIQQYVNAKEDIPIICIESNNSQFYVRAELYKLISLNSSSETHQLAIPEEYITYACPEFKISKMPQNTSVLSSSFKKTILYHPPKNLNTSNILNVIKSLNILMKHKILIISNLGEYNTMVLNISNDHINRCENYDSRIDIVVSAGYQALEYLLNGVPVIIAGERGLGGLITPDNIYKHIQCAFSGRIGGTINEYIPERLFLLEINRVLDIIQNNKSKYNEIIFGNQRLAEQHYKLFNINRKLREIKEEVRIIFGHLKYATKFKYLKPKLSSRFNISYNDSQKLFILMDTHTNQVIGTGGKEEFKIFKELNGKNRVLDLAQGGILMDLQQFIEGLWRKKVIYFEANDL